MSCISVKGEYSNHELGDDFVCAVCFAFDKDAALARVAELEAVIQTVLTHLSGPVPAVDEWWVWTKEALSMLSTARSVVLGEHDREVRAQAIEDAAEAAEKDMNWGYLEGASNWLRERAAAIRKGEDA